MKKQQYKKEAAEFANVFITKTRARIESGEKLSNRELNALKSHIALCENVIEECRGKRHRRKSNVSD